MTLSYALKRTDPAAIVVAAPALAALIAGSCWLEPNPASNGSREDNLALVPGALIKLAMSRSQLVESSTACRRRGLCGLQPEEHYFVRTAGPMERLPLNFVDNFITMGNTIRAARSILGWGTGLAYADASSPFNHRLRQAANVVWRTIPHPQSLEPF